MIHQLIVEEQLTAGREMMHPICLEGERTCPPEDCGGPWGYADFLEALADADHEQHEEFVGWAGEFEPEEFDTAKVTQAMRRGLAGWRHG